jgi:diguanylate cyclase (GGDEF)-like protein
MARHVLVIEPSRPVALALKKLLEADGWTVEIRESSPEPTIWGTDHFDVALVAIEAQGEATVKLAKNVDPTLPVVLLFPPERDDADRTAAQAGADGVLIGPLKRPVVLSLMAGMARLRGLLKQIVTLEHKLEGRAGAKTPAPNANVYDFDFFKRVLLMEVKRSRRYGYPISLALVAIDGWRELTATLGGPARAKLSAALLTVLSESVRDIDIPVVYSEERFLVFMPHTHQAGALVVARRLCKRVREQIAQPQLTASVGLAAFEGGQGTISFASLIKRASDALRQAQLDGGDRPCAAIPEEEKRFI